MKYSKPQNGMLNILDHFFDDELFNLSTSEKTIIPSYDVVENESEYFLEFGLAGFSKEDVSLNIEENVLTVEGERKSDENINYTHKGNFYGKFKKTFTLPDNVMANKISASWKDGMLTITIPKEEKTKLSKSIEIT